MILLESDSQQAASENTQQSCSRGTQLTVKRVVQRVLLGHVEHKVLVGAGVRGVLVGGLGGTLAAADVALVVRPVDWRGYAENSVQFEWGNEGDRQAV